MNLSTAFDMRNSGSSILWILAPLNLNRFSLKECFTRIKSFSVFFYQETYNRDFLVVELYYLRKGLCVGASAFVWKTYTCAFEFSESAACIPEPVPRRIVCQ